MILLGLPASPRIVWYLTLVLRSTLIFGEFMADLLLRRRLRARCSGGRRSERTRRAREHHAARDAAEIAKRIPRPTGNQRCDGRASFQAPNACKVVEGDISPSDSAMIDKPEPRRFSPPWIAEETDACFIVRDANGHALAYV
jgi:hypothetical protein